MKLSLTWLLILMMVLTTLFMTAGIIYVSYDHYAILTEITREQRQEALLGADSRLQLAMESMANISTTLSNLDAISSFCNSTEAQQYQSLKLVRAVLDNTVFFSDPVEIALLWLSGDRVVRSSQPFMDVLSHKTLYDILASYQLDKPFYNTIITPVINSSDQLNGCFAVISPIFASGYQGASVLICSGAKVARQALEDGAPYLLAQDGTPVFCSSDALMSQVNAFAEGNASPQMSYPVLKWDSGMWTLYTSYEILSPQKKLLAAVQDNGMVIGMVLLTQLALGFLLYRLFLVPFMGIGRQVAAIDSPEKRVRRPRGSCSELVALTENINDMLERIHQLTQHVVRSEELLMNATMARLQEHNLFLQTQINPHFLYNCLECMRGMVAEKNTDAVEEIIANLSHIYRYSAVAKYESTLQSELDVARHYMRILQLRYTQGFTLTVDVPEELMEWTVLRMIFEPIIENAVRHGMIQDRRQEGHVWIRAWAEDEWLMIAIENDGACMDPDTLEKYNALFAQTEQFEDRSDMSHIGMTNVHDRIRLIYGEGSGLHIENRKEGGVRILIRILQESDQYIE